MHRIIIQNVAPKTDSPKKKQLRLWAQSALKKTKQDCELTIRIVDREEMTTLNESYRKKAGPTNVLSFPSCLPEGVELETPLLGDIVICADVVNHEAQEQNKSTEAHWAHMVIHGLLHLQGYDHETEAQAKIMEPLEVELMSSLGFPNPYDGEYIKDHE